VRLPPFALERYFAEHEFSAPYLLSSSDVDPFGLAELLALADDEGRAMWDGLSLAYTETAGHPRLRAAIASLYSGVEPDEVLVFGAGTEAIFAWANVALGPGDHAIVVWPTYQALHEVARGTGAEITLLPLEHDDGWELDLAAVRAELRPETRAIVINYPHHPTGAQLDRRVFDELFELAEEAGVTVFSDEAFRWLEHSSEPLPAAVERSPRGVSLGLMSKALALPGLRIGWLASHDRELLGRLAIFKDYTTICSSAPSEVLAIIALGQKDAVLARTGAILDANLPLLDEFFERWAGTFEWVRPRASSMGFPRLQADLPVADFAAELVEAEGVMLLPGTVYGHEGNHFRFGYGRRNLPEALARLERFASARLG
jgi:aspartate/methionine/tyrosine aminotransferase